MGSVFVYKQRRGHHRNNKYFFRVFYDIFWAKGNPSRLAAAMKAGQSF